MYASTHLTFSNSILLPVTISPSLLPAPPFIKILFHRRPSTISLPTYLFNPASPRDINMFLWATSHPPHPHYPLALVEMWIFFSLALYMRDDLHVHRAVLLKGKEGPEASSHWRAFNQA